MRTGAWHRFLTRVKWAGFAEQNMSQSLMIAPLTFATRQQTKLADTDMRLFGRSEDGEWWLDLSRAAAPLTDFGRSPAINAAYLPKSVIVISCRTELLEEPPPPPFVTETLCETGFAELGLPVDKVMAIADRLYRNGLISCPLTTNPNIHNVDAVWNRISAIGIAWGSRPAEAPRRFPAILESPNPGGIVPIDWGLPVGGSMAVDEVLYSLIWERALASQMTTSRHSMREVEAYSAADERQRFIGSRVDLVEAGWRKFTSRKDWVVGKDVNALGGWQTGEILTVRRIVVEGVDLEMSSISARKYRKGGLGLQ
jgi:DNA topoisomerase IA